MKTFFKIFVISFLVLTGKFYSQEIQEKTRWATDVLVRGGSPTMGIDWDGDEVTGYLYALLDSNGIDGDHAELYRSTDNGQTWSLWYRPALNNDSSVTNPRVRVVRDAGDTSWVCAIGIWCESSGNDELWMRGFKTIDPNQRFSYLVDNYVDYYDIASDKGDSASIYVTYVKNDNIIFARNDLSGPWQDYDTVFSNPGPDPSPQVATNSRSDIGVCFVDTSLSPGGRDEIRMVRSKDKGQSWLPVQQVVSNSGNHGISELDMAYSEEVGSQVAWITNTWTVAANRRVGFCYSTDTSASWAYGGILAGPPSMEEYECNIRTNRSSGELALLYTGDLGYMLSAAYAFSSDGSPNIVDTAIFVSDDSLSEIANAPAIVGWTGGGPGVMYVDYGENNVYFDTLVYVSGIEEEENILSIEMDDNILTSRRAIARYSVAETGMVNLNLVNVNGQVVRRILSSVQTPGTYEINVNYEGLSSGIYILHLETKSGKACGKTILLQ